MDAFATPFVQGRLRDEEVAVSVVSECALSRRPMYMEIDRDMNCTCGDQDCSPVVFVPDVDFKNVKDPNIIDAF